MVTPDDAAPPTEDDDFDALLADAARLTPVPVRGSPGLQVGTSLCDGRFRVLRRVGAGGSGVVFEAEDDVRGGRVALKSLSRLDPVGIVRLKNEFRALADVLHPNLVRLHELHAEGPLWFFSMEYVDGVPFDAWVRPGGALDLPRLRSALGQLVGAVAALHAAGKLHRDLKPDNVLVRPDGRLAVLDFGLVSDPRPGGVGQTDAGEWVAGTPAYMSPEQCLATPATPQSDLYQLGTMLFEALADRLPFTGGTRALIDQKPHRDAPSVQELAPDAPADLAQLCDALLQRDPAARPRPAELRALLASDTRTPLPRAPSAVGEPLFGRELPLAELDACFEDTLPGRPAVVQVTGAAGVGKSALVERFLQGLAEGRRAVVLTGRCYRREHVPYQAFDRVVDALTRHLRRLPEVDAAALLPRDVRALCDLFPVLGGVSSIANAPSRPAPDDRTRRRRAWDALTELLLRLGDRGPVVLHVDDLQWIDRDSEPLLRHLVAALQDTPLLVLLTHDGSTDRDPAPSGWEGTRSTLRLPPLSPVDAEALSVALLGDLPGARALGAEVARAAGGVPLAIGTLARAIRTVPEVDARVDSIEALLGRHLDALDGTARGALVHAALCAGPVPEQVIADAAELGDSSSAMETLRQRGLLHQDVDGRVECQHAELRTLVEARLEPEALRACHRRLGAAWKRGPGADPELLYTHAEGAGETREAMGYALRAAARAQQKLAFEQAVAYFRAALRLTGDDADAARAIRASLARALSLAGRWAEAGDIYALEQVGVEDPAHRAELRQEAARHLLGSGRCREGLPLLRERLETLGIAWPTRPRLAMFWAWCTLLWLRVSGARARPWRPARADPREAALLDGLLDGAGLLPPYDLPRGVYFVSAFVRRALRFGEPGHVAVASGMLASMMCTSRVTRGFGRRLAARTERLAAAVERADLAAAAFGFSGYAYMLDGQLERAATLGARGDKRLEAAGRAHIYQRWAARSVQACALLLLGRMREGARVSAAIGVEARLLGDVLAMVGGEAVVGRLLDDDVASARTLLEEKEAVLSEAGGRGALQPIVDVERVCLALYEGRGAEALASTLRPRYATFTPFDLRVLTALCALQALPAASGRERRRLLTLVARARRSLRLEAAPVAAGVLRQLDAALGFAAGDTAAAREHLAAAADIYRAAGMRLHAAIADLRRGRLLAGAEGEAAVARALAVVRGEGIAAPERWAAMLAPGFGPD